MAGEDPTTEPTPVLSYKPQKTVEQRLTKLERELRLWQAASFIMSAFAIALATVYVRKVILKL